MGREAQKLTVLGLSEMLVSRPPEGVERPSVWPARALSPSMLPSGHSHSQLCAVRGASAGLETHLPFPASPSLPATRAVLGPRAACSLRPWSGVGGGGEDVPRPAVRLLPLHLAHSSPPASPGLWLDQPHLCSIWEGLQVLPGLTLESQDRG